jgi:hypothetical protein
VGDRGEVLTPTLDAGTVPVWPDGEVDADATGQAIRCWGIALAAPKEWVGASRT